MGALLRLPETSPKILPKTSPPNFAKNYGMECSPPKLKLRPKLRPFANNLRRKIHHKSTIFRGTPSPKFGQGKSWCTQRGSYSAKGRVSAFYNHLLSAFYDTLLSKNRSKNLCSYWTLYKVSSKNPSKKRVVAWPLWCAEWQIAAFRNHKFQIAMLPSIDTAKTSRRCPNFQKFRNRSNFRGCDF